MKNICTKLFFVVDIEIKEVYNAHIQN